MSVVRGSGRSFPPAGNDGAAIENIQDIVGTGYKQCSRRTYLLRIVDNTLKPSPSLNEFKASGIIPLYTKAEKGSKLDWNELTSRLNDFRDKVKKYISYASVDIGFTYKGLSELKINDDLLDLFRRKSPAFYNNAFSRAQRHLGDTGLSDPQYWGLPYQDQGHDSGFHIAVIAHFTCDLKANPPVENENCIRQFESEMVKILLGIDTLDELLKGCWVEVSIPLGNDGKEHFGYSDGITAPVYSKNVSSYDDKGFRAVHALGEILLGHKRNDGDNLYSYLDITRKKNTNIELQTIPIDEEKKIFFKNSSFGVLRKMEQRVEEFDHWVDHHAKKSFVQDQALGLQLTPGDPYYVSKKWIRSKILGRTPNGALLTPNITIHNFLKKDIAPKATTENTQLEKSDRFHYENVNGKKDPRDDSQGLACPFSSHIRRMNPLDDPITPFIHRPVMRRGIPYTEEKSKGLSGLFICADIVEQFEHLVGKWANHRVLGIPDDSTCKDPIIGNHEPQNNELYLCSQSNIGGNKYKVSFDEPFVITRGCAYIWLPSITTLKELSNYTKSHSR